MRLNKTRLNVRVYSPTIGEQAINLLRRYGTNAHVYLPGVGVLNGLTAVDGLVGLDLDAMGVLGVELAPATTSTVGWSTIGSAVLSSDGTAITATTSTVDSGGRYTMTATNGKTYLLTCALTNNAPLANAGIAAYNGVSTIESNLIIVGSSGTCRAYVTVASGSSIQLNIRTIGSAGAYGGSIVFGNISVREITGIHATAAGAARPTLRRGLVNELLNSAAPATQSVTCIAAPYTLALYGTGSVVLSGTGA